MKVRCVKKVCGVCGQEKPVEDFYVQARGDLYSYCKACVKVKTAEWRAKNPERAREITRKAKERQREKYDPAANRERWRRTRYKLEKGEYDALLEAQGHACAICKRPSTDCLRGVLCVDHDHNTRKVRGLLCVDCNSAIGRLRDDPDLVFAAWEYLVVTG